MTDLDPLYRLGIFLQLSVYEAKRAERDMRVLTPEQRVRLNDMTVELERMIVDLDKGIEAREKRG